jgi:hypothetical protein
VINAPQPKESVTAEAPLAKTPEARDAGAEARGRRRSDRVFIKIPIEVSGTDLAGNSFRELTHTLAINRNGASIVLTSSLPLQKQITVKNIQTGQSCIFQASRTYTVGPQGLREWAVECLEPAPNFWRISFPDWPEATSIEEGIGCLLECMVCQYREMTRVSLSEYRTIEGASLARDCIWCGKQTQWRFADVQGEQTSSPDSQDWGTAASLSSGVELRREDRRIVQLPILIRDVQGREESTTTEDVSRSGLRCTADMDLQRGEQVLLWRGTEEGVGEPEFRGQVIWRREINEKHRFRYGMKVGPVGGSGA